MEPSRHRNIKSPIVLIPALNEEESVGSVVSEIIRLHHLPVVVIDDASVDRTRVMARLSGAVVLPLRNHLGAWGATQAGLRYAFKHRYPAAVTMDADGQHPAAGIALLLEEMDAGEADVVVGSWPERGSAARRLAWTLFRQMTGIKLKDLTSGFRAYNRRAVSCLVGADTSLLDYQDLGVLIHLRLQGLRMKEIAVEMRLREEGHSRIFTTWWTVMRYLLYTGILCASRSRFNQNTTNS